VALDTCLSLQPSRSVHFRGAQSLTTGVTEIWLRVVAKGKGKGKGRYSSSWKPHLRATARGITQFYLPPDTSERAPPNGGAEIAELDIARPDNAAPDQTRQLSYRKDDRAMCPMYGCHEKFRESSQTPPATFPEICNGPLFRSILRMCVQNLKFEALSVPEIIGGTQEIWAVPGYAHAPFSPKFLMGFCSHGHLNISAKFEVRSFTRSWDNRGYSKNWGSLWIRPRSIFSRNFKGLLFGWTL